MKGRLLMEANDFEKFIESIPKNHVPTANEIDEILAKSQGFVLTVCIKCGDLIFLNEEGLCSKCSKKRR